MAELDALIQLMPSGQQTRTDRELVMSALAARGRHANLLVFGCGRDSAFWAHTMNRYGTTVFLEDVTQCGHIYGLISQCMSLNTRQPRFHSGRHS